MEHGMVRPGRYWVLGGAVSEGGPGVINVYNREQIKKVNLEGLPMCRMHDPSMVAGKWMTSLANEGIRYVMGHIDAQDPMTMGVVHELLSGQLKDLSLTDYAVAIKGDEEDSQTRLLKFPMEVSLVQEGNRPNCHILAVVADEDLKKWMAEKTNGASPSTPQTPPAQSPPGTPPAQAQGQPSDALIPGNLDSSLVGDISKIRKEHLTKISPEELQNVTMVALMKVQEMAGELQKFDQYKKERDVEERKRRDADNEAYYNYIKQFQDQNKADHFKQMYQELTTGKDWSELEKQGRLNSIVLANFSKMSETIAAKDKELEMWKKRSAPSSEPEDVASFITRAVTSASYPTKKQRFETSDIERAEKKPATPSMNPNYNPNAPTQQLVSGNQAPPSDDVQAMISRMYKGLQGPLTRPQGGNIGVPDPTRR